MAALKKLDSFRIPLILILLGLIHFSLRWALANSPSMSELDYDQAAPGLMALHAIRGEPQIMLWGQPRTGAVESYLAGLVFFIFGPSALAYRVCLMAVSGVLSAVVYVIGKKFGGPKVGLVAAGYWALPPVFLSFTGNYPTSGHLEAVLFGSFILFGTCLILSRTSPSSTNKDLVLMGLLGVLAGVGWWSSLLIIPFLLTLIIGLAGTRPRLLLSPLPLIGLAGYLLGSLPFWLWNYFHDFNTLFHLGEKDLLSIGRQVLTVIKVVIPTFIGIFWDGQGVAHLIPGPLVLVVLTAFYLPLLVISLVVFIRWFKRIAGKRLPFQNPVDYFVLTIWLFILIRATGEPESLGLSRYNIVLYVSLSLLISLWVVRIMNFRKLLGLAAVILLLGFNLLTNILYLEQDRNNPAHPAGELIKTFQKLGIRYFYADNRLAQVITFESGEKIIGADYLGMRNYDYLKTVDQAPAGETAIVTHRKLGNPLPETMESSLLLLGGTHEKQESGDYVFFYHFQEPVRNLSPLAAAEWEVAAGQEKEEIPLIKDRDILTAWRVPRKTGEWLQIDLGRTRTVSEISIYTDPIESGLSHHLRLEISGDGRSWKTISRVEDIFPGLYWYQGRPKLDENKHLQIVFPAREGRFLRITNLSPGRNPDDFWTVAEVFVYGPERGRGHPPDQAKKILDQARQNLDRWTDDPTGPHHSAPRMSMGFRIKKVNWPALIHSLSEALRLAPDREEAHRLFGQALLLGNFSNEEGSTRRDPLGLFSKTGLTSIPSKGWKVTSNVNGAEARLAVDGDPLTRWASLKGQEAGMFFQVDLESEKPVNGFSLFINGSLNDYPRGLKVFSSLDGEKWQEMAVSSYPAYAFDQNRLYKKTYYRIGPAGIRHLRLLETGGNPVYWWSIYEMEIFGGKG
jgi:4-amino-4-deoxy-L-arabinose transferase-like glycosyltransferase